MPRELPPVVVSLEMAAVAIGALAVLMGALAAVLATRPASAGSGTIWVAPLRSSSSCSS